MKPLNNEDDDSTFELPRITYVDSSAYVDTFERVVNALEDMDDESLQGGIKWMLDCLYAGNPVEETADIDDELLIRRLTDVTVALSYLLLFTLSEFPERSSAVSAIVAKMRETIIPGLREDPMVPIIPPTMLQLIDMSDDEWEALNECGGLQRLVNEEVAVIRAIEELELSEQLESQFAMSDTDTGESRERNDRETT